MPPLVCNRPLALQFRALTGVHNLLGIDRVLVDLLFKNLTVFSNQVIDAASGFVLVNEDSVFVSGFAPPIAQQGERDSDLVGKGFVCEGAIHAHTQDLGVGSFQLFKILLEVLHLLGSTTGEGKYVEGQHDILLAAEVT